MGVETSTAESRVVRADGRGETALVVGVPVRVDPKNGDTSDTCAKVEARSRLVTICAKMACIHVVPDLGYEHTNTSVGSVAKF